MRRLSGWDVAVLAAVVVLSALVLADGPDAGELAGGLAANAALLVVWFVLGRRGDESRAAVPASALLILIAGVATALTPTMATIQAIVFPVLWFLARTATRAVVANVLLALSVATGFVVGLGASPSVVLQAAVVEVISLAGSFAIGFWITRISRESDERKRLLSELRETQALLAAASRDAGVRGERERLARELHDTIAQDLTGLVLLIQRTRRELQAADPTVGETIDLLEESARATLAETRGLVASSAPLALTDGGIVAALERLGDRIEREAGIAVTVEASGASLDRDEEVVLLRCAQEALSNARRHADATSAIVSLVVDDETAAVSVRDDGAGFDPSSPRSGFGLDGLADRLALVGGRLTIDSAPGRGTTLTARLPRREAARADVTVGPGTEAGA